MGRVRRTDKVRSSKGMTVEQEIGITAGAIWQTAAKIGNGSMGEMWKARAVHLDRIVAIMYLKDE
jgi:hypothetical protein